MSGGGEWGVGSDTPDSPLPTTNRDQNNNPTVTGTYCTLPPGIDT